MKRQYFNGIWHAGFLNLNTGAVETSSSYPNSIYSDLIFFPAGSYTIEGATLGDWRLRTYNSDGSYNQSLSYSSTAIRISADTYARILIYNGLSNEQKETFKIYRGGDEMIRAIGQYTIAEIYEECNVVISNESHVFRADKNNTAVAGNTSIQIYGYQGNTQVATTVGTISGLPSAGMTATINNNGKTNTSITVAVTTTLTSSIANNGVLTIPVTVAGKTFNKTFSWSKAQTGATGATGSSGTSITIKSKEVAYVVSDSGSTIPSSTANWSTIFPNSIANGKYLWTRTTVTYSDNTKTESYSVGYKGTNGINGTNGTNGKDGTSVTITSQTIHYFVSSSGTTIPADTEAWSTSFPTSIAQGKYLWTKTTVTYSNGTSTKSYTNSYQGKNGTTARTYWVSSNANTVTRSMKGILTPETITFSSYYRDGTSATTTAYAGRFIIQESANGSSWTTKYTSSANESSKVYTPTKTTNLVKCTIYAAGGTTNALDTLTIGIIDSIDDLEIGGTNLLRASDFKNTTVANSKWSCEKCTKVFGSDDAEFGTYMKNVFSAAGRCYYGTTNVWKTGQTYAFSFYAKTDTEGTTIRPSRSIADFGPTFNLTTSWQRFSGLINCTTTAEAGTFSLSVNQAATIYITKVKLEVGNSPSKWSPAPEDLEDIEERIEEVNKSVSEVIVGTQTAATNVWTGVASFSTLADGQQISYWLPYAGNSSAATLNLTLAGGTTTGAKNLYYGGTTRITTHYPAGSVIHLTYRENVPIAGSTTKYTGWWADANYNTDTYDRIRYNSAITALAAISSGRVIAGTASGFKHIAASTAFDINKPILLAGSAIAANATGSNNYIAYSNINLASTKSGFTGTKGKTVYIVGTLNGTTFTPNSTVFTTTEPTTENGLVYIALGLMSSTTNSTLYPEHPLYKYVNGKFQSLSQVAYEAQENLNNLKIGGRNFLLKTNQGKTNWAFAFQNGTASMAEYTDEDDGIRGVQLTCEVTSTGWQYTSYRLGSTQIALLKENTQYTLSCDIKSNIGAREIGFTIRDGDSTDLITNEVSTGKIVGNDTWERLVITVTTIADFSTKTLGSQLIYLSGFNKVGQTVIKNLKLEEGNIDTTWTAAPEDQSNYVDETVNNANEALKEYIDKENKLIKGEVSKVDESIDTRIAENNTNIISQVSTSVKEEFDKTTGKKIRDLEQYTSHFKVTGNALTYDIDKTKGTNLVKNSVMLQNKTNANKKTRANFWLNKNLAEDFFTHVTCSDVDSVRTKTTSGSAIVFDYTVDSTNLTYDYILSSPIDFKIDTDNIMLSYKIKGSITAGTFFAGLVFYKKDSTATGLGASTAFTQSTGIPTAHYLALNEYTTTANFADFTKDYILKTTPFVKSDKKIVNCSCEVSSSNTITLPWAPYLVNGACPITIYDLNGEETIISTSGTTVNLGDNDWPSMVAVQYERALSNFSGTTATSITAGNFSTVPINEVLMYYNTSDKKIWVYNPFTGTYVKSTNLYNGTELSEVDSVRVILGVRGASTSAKFKGHIEISDLKVEYDSLSQIWTQHPGETYSKRYQMDEKGFSISSDTNMMFIDEDEIAAYTLDAEGKPETDNPVFQISGEETILKKTIIREDLMIENSTADTKTAFVMKQYNVGNQWYFLFY